MPRKRVASRQVLARVAPDVPLAPPLEPHGGPIAEADLLPHRIADRGKEETFGIPSK
jgi:hypothetical protein